jgi:hypothetical protein
MAHRFSARRHARATRAPHACSNAHDSPPSSLSPEPASDVRRGGICIAANSAYDAAKGAQGTGAHARSPAHPVQCRPAKPAGGGGGGQIMKTFALVLELISLAGMIFGWWGVETVSGRRHFDEMAGIIPFVTGIASIVLLFVAAVVYYFAKS